MNNTIKLSVKSQNTENYGNRTFSVLEAKHYLTEGQIDTVLSGGIVDTSDENFVRAWSLTNVNPDLSSVLGRWIMTDDNDF